MVSVNARLWIQSFWNTEPIKPCLRSDLWFQTAYRDQGRVQMFFPHVFGAPLAYISHGSSKTRPQLTMERKLDHAIGSLGLTLPHLTEIDPSPHARIWDHALPVPDAATGVKGGRVEACAIYDRMSHRVLYSRGNKMHALLVSL